MLASCYAQILESEEVAAAGTLFFLARAPQGGILAASLARRFRSGWIIGRSY